MNVLLIAIGGALGSASRYLLSIAILRVTTPFFPYGTFAVNLVGCAAFGVIAGAAQHRLPLPVDLRAFLLVGVLGGFTTFSTYAFDSVTLMRDGQWTLALVNMVGQLAGGVAALWVGLRLAS